MLQSLAYSTHILRGGMERNNKNTGEGSAKKYVAAGQEIVTNN